MVFQQVKVLCSTYAKTEFCIEFFTEILVLTGQVSVNTIGDCEAEIHLTSRMGARSQTLISGLVNYGDGWPQFCQIRSIKF